MAYTCFILISEQCFFTWIIKWHNSDNTLQVAASFASEGSIMAELRQWNEIYGEGGRGSREKQDLTYFIWIIDISIFDDFLEKLECRKDLNPTVPYPYSSLTSKIMHFNFISFYIHVFNSLYIFMHSCIISIYKSISSSFNNNIFQELG